MAPTFTRTDVESDQVVDALVADDFVLEGPVPSHRLVLETFDGDLAAAGLRLEQQVVAGHTTLVLTSRAGGPPASLDTEVRPAWPQDLPPGPFRARLESVTNGRALLPTLALSSSLRTLTRVDARDKPVVSIEVHDDLRVEGEPAPSPWLAEVQGRTGHANAAEAAAAALARLGLDGSDDDVVALVALDVGVSLEGHDTSPTVPLDADEDAVVAFRRVLRHLADVIDATIPGTLADHDIEFLHDLRVAVRRTRSVLTESKGVLPADVRATNRDFFRWLGQVTGPPRELGVYLVGWEDYTAPVTDATPAALDHVRKELEARRRAAHRDLAKALRSPATRDGLAAWRAWLAEADEPDGRHTVGPIVVDRIERAQATVLRAGRAIGPDSPAERLHDLRKDAKRLRYDLECFGSLFPAKPWRGFVDQLKALQDNLGEHQDAEVHLAYLRDLAQDLHHRANVDTDTLLAMGRLTHHIDRRRRRERQAFMERWASYDTKGNARTLDSLLGSVD